MYYGNNVKRRMYVSQNQTMIGLGILFGAWLNDYGKETGCKGPGVLYDAVTIATSSNGVAKLASTISLVSTFLDHDLR